MNVTMKEIASMAQVSQSAVSLILNGKAEGRISQENQQRVMDAIARSGYQRNFAARCLRQKNISTIGILFPVPRNTFYATIISRLQNLLEAHGYMALFSFWDETGSAKQAVRTMMQHQVDGIIACELEDDNIRKFHVPAVLYYQRQPGADTVTIDYQQAISQALTYLTGLGHRRIGFLGLFKDPRYQTFKKEMKRMGLEDNPLWDHDIWGKPETGREAAHQLLQMPPQERPTAVITHNDAAAQGVYYAIHEAGLSIPQDLSIISFDNNESSAFMIPPLTTFDKSGEVIAQALMDRILEKIHHPDTPEKLVAIKQQLIFRQSCGPYSPTIAR